MTAGRARASGNKGVEAVNNFADLPTTVDVGKLVRVLNVLNPLNPLTRKKAGVYKFDGTKWERLGGNEVAAINSTQLGGTPAAKFRQKDWSYYTDEYRGDWDNTTAFDSGSVIAYSNGSETVYRFMRYDVAGKTDIDAFYETFETNILGVQICLRYLT